VGVIVGHLLKAVHRRQEASEMVRCDAGVETQAQAMAKAASVDALEQFKISAYCESLAIRLSSNL